MHKRPLVSQGAGIRAAKRGHAGQHVASLPGPRLHDSSMDGSRQGAWVPRAFRLHACILSSDQENSVVRRPWQAQPADRADTPCSCCSSNGLSCSQSERCLHRHSSSKLPRWQAGAQGFVLWAYVHIHHRDTARSVAPVPGLHAAFLTHYSHGLSPALSALDPWPRTQLGSSST